MSGAILVADCLRKSRLRQRCRGLRGGLLLPAVGGWAACATSGLLLGKWVLYAVLVHLNYAWVQVEF